MAVTGQVFSGKVTGEQEKCKIEEEMPVRRIYTGKRCLSVLDNKNISRKLQHLEVAQWTWRNLVHSWVMARSILSRELQRGGQCDWAWLSMQKDPAVVPPWCPTNPNINHLKKLIASSLLFSFPLTNKTQNTYRTFRDSNSSKTPLWRVAKIFPDMFLSKRW